MFAQDPPFLVIGIKRRHIAGNTADNCIDDGKQDDQSQGNDTQNNTDLGVLILLAGGIVALLLKAHNQAYNSGNNTGQTAQAAANTAQSTVNGKRYNAKDKYGLAFILGSNLCIHNSSLCIGLHNNSIRTCSAEIFSTLGAKG